ncbi:MAG: hypothetical protein K9J06_07045 [Flavobacteriales bacterium]|nr:hypothetical protein [Flavobacteriales bacterium]
MANIGLASQIIGEKRYETLILFGIREATFLRLLAFFVVVAAVCYPYPHIAMWIGFMLAGYSAIANDSIQTIGTFIASNEDKRWWQLWLYIGGIFIVTVLYSWLTYDGDVSFQRLTSKGFSESPTEFHFLQLASPIVLLFITRLRMPVSTTFMLLSAFSSDASGILSVAQKSLSGYVVAFVTAMVVWYLGAGLIKKLTTGTPHRAWTWAQWLISGWLWSMWITHDAANIAIFLNRKLTLNDFLFFAGFIFFGLGLLFYLRGDKIQQIIKEKSQVTDVRAASVIDLVYAFILLVFIELSTIPMSTTWVFLGLLGGREIAMQISKHSDTGRAMGGTLQLVLRDVGFATLGLVISVMLAVAVNPMMQQELAAYFGWQ